MRFIVFVLASVVTAVGSPASAQMARPRAELTPMVDAAAVRPRTTVAVKLKVELPKDVHVQSDKPRDPELIPTVLTVTPPPGVTVAAVTYPKASDLKQEGQDQPLAVFEQTFTIEVRLALDATVAPGELVVPARLRYQACDAVACYPPARADTSWTLHVQAAQP